MSSGCVIDFGQDTGIASLLLNVVHLGDASSFDGLVGCFVTDGVGRACAFGTWRRQRNGLTCRCDELVNANATVRVENSGDAFLIVGLVLAVLALLASRLSTSLNWEDTCDLRENTNLVHFAQIGDDVSVLLFVLEQESTDIGLSTLERLLDGSANCLVLDDNGLVESREERRRVMGSASTCGYTEGTVERATELEPDPEPEPEPELDPAPLELPEPEAPVPPPIADLAPDEEPDDSDLEPDSSDSLRCSSSFSTSFSSPSCSSPSFRSLSNFFTRGRDCAGEVNKDRIERVLEIVFEVTSW